MAEPRPDEKYDEIECRRLIRVSEMYTMLPSGEPMTQMAHQMKMLLRDMRAAESRAKQAETDLSTIKNGSARENTEMANLAIELADARATIEELKAAAAPVGKKKGKKAPPPVKQAPANPEEPEISQGASPYSRNR